MSDTQRVVTVAEVERLERENAELMQTLDEFDRYASFDLGYLSSPFMRKVRAILARRDARP